MMIDAETGVNAVTGRPTKTVQTMPPPDIRQAEILPGDTEAAMFF